MTRKNIGPVGAWCARVGAGLLTALALPAGAQVLTINQIDFPASIGRASDLASASTPLDATVQVRYLRQASVATVLRVSLPPVLQVAPPALPVGCQLSTVAGVAGVDCAVPAGTVGTTGSLSLVVRGRQLGGLSMTATAGTSSATRGGSVITAGNIGHLLTQDASGPYAAGAPIAMSWRPTLDAAADDLPAQAVIVLSDRLPGTATDFTLQAIDLSEAPGVSCDSVAQAQASRTLTCRVSGPLTRAALGALRIRFSGTAGTSGSFVHQATAALQDGSPYLDARPDDNVVTSAYSVDPAADLQAAIAFTPHPVLAGSTQSLTLSLSNNGPMAMPAGAQLALPLAPGITVTELPAGCTGVVTGQTLTSAATLRCTAAALPLGASQSWVLGLRMPSAAGTGTWTTTASPAAGWRDANAANDSASTLYTVSGAFADLGLSKSKVPLYGPVVPGTVVTTTITVRNEASSTAAASYTAAGGAQPLRVVDYLLPAEIDPASGDNGVSAVSAGWSCAVSTASDPANAARNRRVVCQRTAAGTLAPGESLTLSFSTRVSATMDGAPLLENRACTGETALAALGLSAADGPQPPGNGQTTNDCAIAGGYLRATTATTGRALVELRQWSSTVAPVAGQDTATSAAWHDEVADPARLAGDQSTLYWRIELATPAAAPQVTIPTLLLYNGSLPGLLNVSSPGAPAPGYRTPAISVTRELLSGSATLTGCPTVIAAGSNQLVCTLTQVAPGTRLRLTMAVPRPLASGLLANTMAWVTSPDAFLTPVPGKVVDDDAAVQVLPRSDLALTSLSMAPTQPRIGQTVQFVATAQNLGPDEVNAPGTFTMIDDFNVDAAAGQAAYGDLVASGEGLSCAVTDSAAPGEPALAAGHRRVRCTNTTPVARYATRTVTVGARLLKPAGSLPASGAAWTAQSHTARVVLADGLCEFKEETSTSAAVSTTCGDAASRANNAASLQYDVGPPQIDLILGTQLVLPAGQSMPAIGQPLRYRFVLQNNGPSRAEGVTLQARLTLPDGFSVASPTVAAVNNQAVGASRYVLDTSKNGRVSCTLADATLLNCRLAPQAADAWLDAGAEVNFEVELASTGSALVPVTYSQTSVVCADESLAGYESSGNCAIAASADNNNRAAVNDTVFPATDLAIIKRQVSGGAPASLNEPLAWELGLRNRGPQPSTQMRVTDVLPAGFEWLQDSAHAPVLALGSAVGSTPTLSCSASPATLGAATAQQTVSCLITAPSGSAMAVGDDAAHQISLRLWARRRAEWLQGPYGSEQLNTASVAPGVDAAGAPLAVDPVPGNDGATASVVLQRASLAGRVILDRNGNGVVDGSAGAADAPIEGVTITLRGTDSWGATFTRTVRTGADGAWQFDHLPPGVYVVEETQPDGLVDSPVSPAAPDGSGAVAVMADATAGTGTRWTAITLAGGQSVSGLLFADTDAAASLAGRVWRDLDADGVQDGDAAGETGVAGVVITLERVLADGRLEAAGTATTGADGRWSVTGLTAGTYRVSEGALPDGSGLVDGRAVAGQVAGSAAGTVTAAEPNRIDAVTLGANQAGTNHDFAELPVAAIRGAVWLDADGDGLRDADESGIPDSRVRLVGTDDRGTAVDLEVRTDAQGQWRFDGLRPGRYRVLQPQQPTGTTEGAILAGAAAAGAGAGGALNADGQSEIGPLTLGAGASIDGLLFGERPASPDLRVTATASATTVTAGRTLTLMLTTANAGSVPTSGPWSVSDLLPAGFTLAAPPTGAGWTCDGSVGGRAFSCSRSDVLAAGATLAAPITVPVQVASTAVGTLRDAVLVAGGGEATAAAPTAAEQAALQTGGDPSTLTACTATPQHQACQLAITVRAPGAVSGTAWLDSGSVASRLDGTDVRLAGWTVELVDAGATVVARTTTASDGSWRIGDLEPGLPLQLRYREPASGVVFGWPVNGEQGTAQADCLADADALSQGRASACVRSAGQPWSRIVVAPGAELVQQSLPVSAGGVVYDSTTRQPVAGARVSFAPQGSCAGFDPARQMVGASLPGGAASGYTIDGQTISMLTGAQGLYQFQFLAGSGAPSQCTFTLAVQASGYVSPSAAIPAESRPFAPVADDPAIVVAVQSQATAPVGGASTVWFSTLAAGGAVATAVNNHLPLDPAATAVLTLAKTGDRSRAEVGDSLRYTITVQRGAGTRPTQTTVVDRLPAGFTYIRGSASVNGTRIADPAGGLGPVLSFQLGAMAASGSDADRLVLRYRVRVDTGALQGDGVNRAVAHGCAATASCVGADGRTPLSGASTSNEGRHTVAVGGGVFATEACLAGKVFVDCNHDHVQGAEELGIPGVRLILSDGTNLVSDVEGKYAVCGLAPRSHVLRVDETTLPRGSRLTTSSGRNLGDAGSLWLDLKHGELHRADVVEGSCSNTVLEQVKARRALGEVTAPQTERAGTRALRFDSKAHGLDAQRSPARGTDGANQRVRPRSVAPAAADAPSEAVLPVPDLPMNRPPPRGRRTGDEPTSGDDDATR